MIFFSGPGQPPDPAPDTPHLMRCRRIRPMSFRNFRPLTCLKAALTALPTVWRRSSLIRILG
jgi:hypothetical protein